MLIIFKEYVIENRRRKRKRGIINYFIALTLLNNYLNKVIIMVTVRVQLALRLRLGLGSRFNYGLTWVTIRVL